MGSVVVSREKIGNGLQNHSGLIKIERVDALLDVSVDLGTEHEAHVIGLYVVPGPAVYPALGPYAVPEVIDIVTQYFDEQLKNVKSKFETVMKRSGLSFHWLEVKAAAPEVSATVSEIGRVADLVIISETDREANRGVEIVFVANVVMGVGRLVLILPRKAGNRLKIDQIVCDYNGSKEAARPSMMHYLS